jgi:hypothetical protein
VIFSASSTTSTESDEEHDSANDDQNDWGVKIGTSQKVQILAHVDLDIGSNSNQCQTRQKEDKVAEEHNVLENVVTNTHVDAVLFLGLKVKNLRKYLNVSRGGNCEAISDVSL